MTSHIAHPPIIGYVSPLRGRPGERLDFKISSTGNRPFSAHVVRIDCADPNPAGPGMKCRAVDFGLDAAPRPGLQQDLILGSYGHASLEFDAREGFLVGFGFQALLAKDEGQTLISVQDEAGSRGAALALLNGQLVFLQFSSGQEPTILHSGLNPKNGAWYQLRAQFMPDSLALELTAHHLGKPVQAPQAATLTVPDLSCDYQRFVVGARLNDDRPEWLFNGRIDSPSFALGFGESARQIACWDFSANMESDRVKNILGPLGSEMRLVNAPTRAVRGIRWNAGTMDWKSEPAAYGAIHFHEDDLSDCQWETSLSLHIPSSAASAVYGLVVENEEGQDTIPFFVLPGRDGPYARIVYLASTMTYLAYGNHARGNYRDGLAERIKEWGAYPHNPDVMPQFGLSTYNRHPDGSGISLSSRLRPLLTMRPGYLTFAEQKGSGLRHFPADSHLTDWLREKDIAFDVVTDEDLHEEGAALLEPYDIVLTGSHPEYHTRPMLEALQEYRNRGGNLAYLGGNGFYWKIGLGGAAGALLEIRRAEGGVRAWASEPGEYYHQLDGEYGGMWRRNGIAPQAVGGVGFAVQGEFQGSHYRRTPESHQKDVAWLFEGVDGETFGDFGLSGGGAAGFELDQVDTELGSPDHMLVVAVSEQHGPSFKTVPEEILTWTLPGSANRQYSGISAHMAYAKPDKGAGALFAVGSITFLGSLFHDNYNNDVSRILENFIRQHTDG